MRGWRRRLLPGALMAVVGSVLVGGFTSPVSAGAPGVIAPTSVVQGRTYAQWSVAQWLWFLEQPNVTGSQVLDPNPGTPTQPEAVDCSVRQTGDVWFLSGITPYQPDSSPVFRSCTIPRSVYLFFPVIDNWLDNLGCPTQGNGTTDGPTLAATVKGFADSATGLSATIDGVGIPDLGSYRVAAGGFTYVLPRDNALSLFCVPALPAFPPGTRTPTPGAFADGYYVMLAPLSPGLHTISFAGAEASPGPFTEDVTYQITVTK